MTDDTVEGGLGMDLVTGGAGDDLVDGGNGSDTIDGGAGVDTVVGGTGADLIIVNAGEGGDILTGGIAGDTFDFASGFVSATITDFGDGNDVIDLVDVTTATDFASLVITYGADATIDLGGGDVLTLTGITAGLDATDFSF